MSNPPLAAALSAQMQPEIDCQLTRPTTKAPLRRQDVHARLAEGVSLETHISAHPSNTKEWIVFFKKNAGRSFFLVDDQEQVESFADLNLLIAELSAMGLNIAEVHF